MKQIDMERLGRTNELVGQYGEQDGRIRTELMPLIDNLSEALMPTMVLSLLTEDNHPVVIEAGIGAAIALGMTVIYGALVEVGCETAANQALDYIVGE